MTKKLQVALIYDWADTNFGGAEKVLLSLKKLYPQAHLFTSFADFKRLAWLKNFTVVKTSFLQYFPSFLRQKKALIAPLMPLAFESFNLQAYDLVISICSFAAKGVLTTPEQKHLCYLLTPTRFLYSHSEQYRSFLLRLCTNPLTNYLKKWEKDAIWRPDKLIVLSQLVAVRTKQYYRRQADAIIYPPLLTSQRKKSSIMNSKIKKEDFFLCVARLVSYKKINLAIKSCLQLGLSLKIIGIGPELKKYQRYTKLHDQNHLIEFLGNVDQKTLFNCYNKAIALIAPGEEDFGLNIIEANQAQTWIIANQKSGAMELLNTSQAWFVPNQTQKALTETLRAFCATWKEQKKPQVWLRPPRLKINLEEGFFTCINQLVKDNHE